MGDLPARQFGWLMAAVGVIVGFGSTMICLWVGLLVLLAGGA